MVRQYAESVKQKAKMEITSLKVESKWSYRVLYADVALWVCCVVSVGVLKEWGVRVRECKSKRERRCGAVLGCLW
jgi:hypothetical protein